MESMFTKCDCCKCGPFCSYGPVHYMNNNIPNIRHVARYTPKTNIPSRFKEENSQTRITFPHPSSNRVKSINSDGTINDYLENYDPGSAKLASCSANNASGLVRRESGVPAQTSHCANMNQIHTSLDNCSCIKCCVQNGTYVGESSNSIRPYYAGVVSESCIDKTCERNKETQTAHHKGTITKCANYQAPSKDFKMQTIKDAYVNTALAENNMPPVCDFTGMECRCTAGESKTRKPCKKEKKQEKATKSHQTQADQPDYVPPKSVAPPVTVPPIYHTAYCTDGQCGTSQASTNTKNGKKGFSCFKRKK